MPNITSLEQNFINESSDQILDSSFLRSSWSEESDEHQQALRSARGHHEGNSESQNIVTDSMHFLEDGFDDHSLIKANSLFD